MPLLVVALITHVIYQAMTKGWDWGSEASRNAWDASMAGSSRAADRIRQKLADRLQAWSDDTGFRPYAAFGLRAAGAIGRGLGKAGLWTALKGARAAGSVARALGGGALATGGMLGALAQATRDGARNGADWWEARAKNKSERAQAAADRLREWGQTIPGDFSPGPEPAQADAKEQAPPKTGGEAKAESKPAGPPPPDTQPAPPRPPFKAGAATVGTPLATEQPDMNEQQWSAKREKVQHLQDQVFPPTPTAEESQRDSDARRAEQEAAEQKLNDSQARAEFNRNPRAPFRAGTATVGDPTAGDTSTLAPTPVGSGVAAGSAAGAATAVLNKANPKVIEGEIVSNAVATTGATNIQSLGSAADGMKYEQAVTFLDLQAKHANELADLVGQLHALQMEMQKSAKVMQDDNQNAEDALTQFRVTVPQMTEATGLLAAVAGNPAPVDMLMETYMALDAVKAGCEAAATDLRSRFGTAWEIMQTQNAAGEFLNS